MTRGHAARALAVGAELIARGHDVRFYTNLDAYELLTARFGYDRVVEIEMPKYIFKGGKISILSTLSLNSCFLLKRESHTRSIIKDFKDWAPHATVSDFEPLAWWISQKLNIPHITIDSQRFMLSSEMPKRLPLVDNIQRLCTCLLLYLFSPSAHLRIVSKPFAVPYDATTDLYVGAITRKRVDELSWTPQGAFFTVYIKPSLAPRIAEIASMARSLNLKARVFGIHASLLEAHKDVLEHGQTSEDGFLQSLATCEFVVTTPGSQTLAETWALGIPAYLLPEPNQFEQQINLLLALQAAPQQYAKFINENSYLTAKIRGRKEKRCSALGRTAAADAIERILQNPPSSKKTSFLLPLKLQS